MRNCPRCLKNGKKHKNFVECARMESGAWVCYKRCEVCGAKFDVELGAETENKNPFKEGEDG